MKYIIKKALSDDPINECPIPQAYWDEDLGYWCIDACTIDQLRSIMKLLYENKLEIYHAYTAAKVYRDMLNEVHNDL